MNANEIRAFYENALAEATAAVSAAQKALADAIDHRNAVIRSAVEIGRMGVPEAGARGGLSARNGGSRIVAQEKKRGGKLVHPYE